MPFLKDILNRAEQSWGDPNENIGTVVPLGVCGVDERILGVNINGGEIYGIQGQPGSRKTTLVANFIVNQCLSQRLPPGYHICIDTLESGMTIERYAWVLLSIVTTKFLVYWHWQNSRERNLLELFRQGLPDLATQEIVEQVGIQSGGKFVRESVIRPEFFYYMNRTERQKEAIDMARAVMDTWPVIICGISEDADIEIAKQRSTLTTDLEQSFQRWVFLYEHHNMRQLVIDHLQQYVFSENLNDYDQMRRVVSKVAEWQKQTRAVVWLISQIGVTSQREARTGGVKAYAQGGRVLEAQTQLMWEVQYDETLPYIIRLKRPIKSRKGMHPDIAIPIEPNSGAFIGRAMEYRSLNND